MDDKRAGQPQPVNNLSAGLPKKENEPLRGNEVRVDASEAIRPTDQAPLLDAEVELSGVRAVHEAPKLSEDHLKAGIKHVGSTTPVGTNPSGIVLIETEAQARQAYQSFKRLGVKESGKWLWALLIKNYKKTRDKLIRK